MSGHGGASIFTGIPLIKDYRKEDHGWGEREFGKD